MATTPFLLPLISILFLLQAITITESKTYSETVPFQNPNKPQKLTHLHFYLHDITSSDNTTNENITTVNVIKGQLNSSSSIGFTNIVDEILTEGPNLTSKHIGRAQGLYTAADTKIFSLMIALNFVFTEGEFNGSTFAMFGRYSNPLPSKIKELSIIGGTGAFRFAKGYVEIKNIEFTTYVIVDEYNVRIWH